MDWTFVALITFVVAFTICGTCFFKKLPLLLSFLSTAGIILYLATRHLGVVKNWMETIHMEPSGLSMLSAIALLISIFIAWCRISGQDKAPEIELPDFR